MKIFLEFGYGRDIKMFSRQAFLRLKVETRLENWNMKLWPMMER